MFPQGFLFETADTFTGDAGSAAAPAAAEDAAGVDSVQAVEPVVPSAGDTPAAPWTDSLDFREAVAAAADARLQALIEQQGAGDDSVDADDQGTYELDPYSEDFGQNLVMTLNQRLAALLDERLGPIQQTIAQQAQEREQQAIQAGTEGLKDVLSDIQARPGGLGEFADEGGVEEALKLARELSPRYFEAYGPTDRAAELALEQAYKQVRQREDALMAKGEERYKNRLATLSGAGPVAGVGVTGIEQAPGEYTSLADLGRQMDMRRRAAGI